MEEIFKHILKHNIFISRHRVLKIISCPKFILFFSCFTCISSITLLPDRRKFVRQEDCLLFTSVGVILIKIKIKIKIKSNQYMYN